MIPVQEVEVERRRFGGRGSLKAAQSWGGLALFLAVAPMSILWFVVSDRTTITSTGSSGEIVTTTRPSRIDTVGWIVVVPLLVMVVIAAAPLVLRADVAERMRVKSSVLFGGGLVALLIFAGPYYLVYLPGLVALVMAAVTGRASPGS